MLFYVSHADYMRGPDHYPTGPLPGFLFVPMQCARGRRRAKLRCRCCVLARWLGLAGAMWGASVVVELSSRRGAERERGKGLVRRAAHRRGGGRHKSGPPWADTATDSALLVGL